MNSFGFVSKSQIMSSFWGILSSTKQTNPERSATINQDNFEEKVTNAASPVLLDFWAAWCGPCTMLSPVVEELAQEHPEISFGKVNVDDVPELAQKYQISAIPTLLLFRDGKPVDMSIGVKSKEELEAFLK